MKSHLERGRVLFLSSTPILTRTTYADALRGDRICSDLALGGFQVAKIGPDSPREISLNTIKARVVSASARARTGDNRQGRRWASRLAPLVAMLVLWRALRATHRDRHSTDMVVVLNGSWMSLAARAFQVLHPETRLHLDVIGLSHKEAALAHDRFWRLKTVLFERILRSAVRWADLVTAVNDAHARFLESTYSSQPVVVPDRLPDEWFEDLLALPPATLCGPASVLYVGSVARGRLDNFVSACHTMLHARNDVELVIVGGGPDLPRYRELLATLNANIVGYEPHDKLLERYRRAHICYSDIWSDIGTPYKLLEYLAAGRAILTHDTPSTRDLVQDGKEGLLVDSSTDSIERALTRLVDDPSLRLLLGAAAKEKAMRLQNAQSEELLPKLYDATLHRGSAQGGSALRKADGIS